MPVLPLVASTIVVRPGSIRPSRSAASIIATPIRSLTLPPGLNASSLAKMRTPRSSAWVPASRPRSSTIGVFPTSSEMLIGIPDIGDDNSAWTRRALSAAQRDPERAKGPRERFLKAAGAVSDALGGHDYLVASSLTVADILVGTAVAFTAAAGFGEQLPDNLHAYVARLSERDAFQRATAALQG